jgi:hypothetical protein
LAQLMPPVFGHDNVTAPGEKWAIVR